MSSTGIISGLPSSAGSSAFSVQIYDSLGRSNSQNLTLSITQPSQSASPLQITTSSLPSGTAGTTYSATLQGTGGTSPYTWSVISGQLPGGLGFSSGGIISGTPIASGTYSFTIQMADSTGLTASAVFSLAVAVCTSCSGNLAITTTSLPAGSVNTAYNATLAASGGMTPYTWSTSSGQLPPGLALATSGAISGTPTTAGSYNFGLTVADSAGHTLSQTYTVGVSAPSGSLGVLTNSLHLGYLGQAYDAVLTPRGGVAPYTWTVTSGSFPAGLSLNAATGHISGTPTQGGQFTVGLTATDSTQATGSKSFSLEVFEQPTDQYGGFTNLPCPNGPQAQFYTQKIGSRWHLCDPAGNVFFALGISHIDYSDTSINDLGVSYNQAVQAKYGGSVTNYAAVWADQSSRRLKSWAFNTSSDGQAWTIYPWTSGRSPNSFVPFVPLYQISKYSLTDVGNVASDASKSLTDCLDLTVYSGYSAHSAPDVFDPAYAQYVANYFQLLINQGNAQLLTSPWVIGFIPDDSDELWGIGAGLQYSPNGGLHAHDGWIALAASPTKGYSSTYNWTYQNATVYSKQQLASDLQSKYGTIAALNAAWRSNYTTFGSAGGWPKHSTGGTGLLDEDGSSPWLGTTDGTLQNASAGVITDLDAFLLEYWQKYFQLMKSARDKSAPGQLLFSPSMNGGDGLTRQQVLQAAAQYCDVLGLSALTQTLLDLTATYTGDKPYFFEQFTMVANPDSALWRYPRTDQYGYNSQSDRANAYATQANFIATETVTATGTKPVVGGAFWAWEDSWGEKSNYGFISFLDNAYDGEEASTTPGRDSWGYPTGCIPGVACEERDYGPFIPIVQSTNLQILRNIASGQ